MFLLSKQMYYIRYLACLRQLSPTSFEAVAQKIIKEKLDLMLGCVRQAGIYGRLERFFTFYRIVK